MGDEGTTHLAHALEENSPIEVLDLSNNALSAAAGDELASALENNHVLRDLALVREVKLVLLSDGRVLHIADHHPTASDSPSNKISGYYREQN